ncbi:MAG: carboxypeptidase-like regulatory domain-containing protein [Chloroflexi bacterium]|nr:carboxypeptidase-like regulatory domain-containing protein [Chloroflexota bacterium]
MGRVIVFALAALIGCGGDGGRFQAPDSGIEGLMLIGPTCAVVGPGQDCDDEPYAGAVKVIERASGKLVATARAGKDGRFRVAVPPGAYTLEPVPAASGLPFGKPFEVTVRPHTYEQVKVSFDSGIR